MVFEKFKKTIEKYDLIKPEEKIVVGVSGGSDSCGLLFLLHRLQEKSYKSIKLLVAHINYALRGEQSDKDEEYVRTLAEKFGLEIYVRKIKKRDWRKEPGNLEEKFRQIRYRFFREVLEKERANKIAVAHTADDNVETILMFFLRGAGLRGLSGMDYKKEKIIRPCLDLTREEIREYLKKNKIKWREDVTNEDVGLTRNKIRLELLPYLEKEFSPKIRQILLANARILKDDEDFILSQASRESRRLTKTKKPFSLSLLGFLSRPVSLQRAILVFILEKFLPRGRYDVSLADLEETLRILKEAKPKSRKVIKGLIILKERDSIIFRKT